jgi:hypothetical protein
MLRMGILHKLLLCTVLPAQLNNVHKPTSQLCTQLCIK